MRRVSTTEQEMQHKLNMLQAQMGSITSFINPHGTKTDKNISRLGEIIVSSGIHKDPAPSTSVTGDDIANVSTPSPERERECDNLITRPGSRFFYSAGGSQPMKRPTFVNGASSRSNNRNSDGATLSVDPPGDALPSGARHVGVAHSGVSDETPPDTAPPEGDFPDEARPVVHRLDKDLLEGYTRTERRQKLTALFVAGIKCKDDNEVTLACVKNFVEGKNKFVRSIRFLKQRGNYMSVKLVTHLDGSDELVNYGFWPDGIFCREWRD